MMRAALWFVGLFALAVAVALFAGNNQAVLSLFWSPYRVDMSLNMALLCLLVLFTLLYACLRGLAMLGQLPLQARRWRQQQKQRAQQQALISGLAYLQAGRLVRARAAAHSLLQHSQGVYGDDGLRALAHLLAADSAHALQDATARDAHYAELLRTASASQHPLAAVVCEGAQMRAARWALDARHPEESLQRLADLPQGAARRTVALRIKLKAARMAQDTDTALETTRLLAKHGGFSPGVAHSLLGSLLAEQIRQCRDTAQLHSLWHSLPEDDRQRPDTTLVAVAHWLALGGDSAQARHWLLPVWQRYAQGDLDEADQQRLWLLWPRCLEGLEAEWLERIEQARQQRPGDARLHYLAGLACMQHQLWGQAEQGLRASLPGLDDARLQASAWRALATLAEQRGDDSAAQAAWRAAAQAGASGA